MTTPDPAVQPAPPASPDQTPPAPLPGGRRPPPAELSTALVHLYRAEVSRANAWRQRLDTTTNWAVGATGVFISIAFGDLSTPPVLLLLGSLLITCFLVMESYRYRYYSLWSYRARLLETNFYASLLREDAGGQPGQPAPAADGKPVWTDTLSDNLIHPAFRVSFQVALGRRLGRGYVWIYSVLLLAWVVKLSLYPEPVTSLTAIAGRAGVLALPGPVMFGLVGLAYLGMLAWLVRHLYWEDCCAEHLYNDREGK